MTAQLTAPCPKCSGPTTSKGEGMRYCQSCNYRFRWPVVACAICGKPKASGQGMRLPYCEEHYAEGQRLANRAKFERHKAKVLSPRQIAPDVSGTQSAPVIVPGRGIECYGDVIEIVYRDYRPWLILNGGNPLPASPIEAALYKKLVEVTK